MWAKQVIYHYNTYIGNHINGIIDLTDKGIGVRQSFLQLALGAWWIDYNKDKQNNKLAFTGVVFILFEIIQGNKIYLQIHSSFTRLE